MLGVINSTSDLKKLPSLFYNSDYRTFSNISGIGTERVNVTRHLTVDPLEKKTEELPREPKVKLLTYLLTYRLKPLRYRLSKLPTILGITYPQPMIDSSSRK